MKTLKIDRYASWWISIRDDKDKRNCKPIILKRLAAKFRLRNKKLFFVFTDLEKNF